MSEASAETVRYVVVCVEDDPETLATLVGDMESICGRAVDVEGCADANGVLNLAGRLGAMNVRVPLIIADDTLPDMPGVDLLLALNEKPEFRATRKILLSEHPTLEPLTRALNRGALHRYLEKPWTRDVLWDSVRSLLTSYFIHHAPEGIERVRELLDTGQIPRAFAAAQQKRRALDLELTMLKRSFLANRDMTDEQVEQAMGAAIDDALDCPARRELPAGAFLTRQDEPVEYVSILESGHVELSRKTGDQEVILHTDSAGRIIGLMSLTHGQQAFYTCRAVTDVTVIPLTLEQLDTALQRNPWLSGYFVTALIRSMATRSMRTAQLKVEVENLNRHLRVERDQLADALNRLEQAQMRLVESEKMATLGQFTAGIAHELNNPVAAIRRAADFVAEDTLSVVAQLPDGEAIRETVESAMTAAPVSTREMRKLVSALGTAVGDDTLTRRLVKLGVTTPDAYRRRFGRLSAPKRERLVKALDRYHEFGTSLRNLRTCSERIAGIVQSLRSYARGDQGFTGDVDVREGLEDTLRLMGHALHDVRVKRSYAELPPIECQVGKLNQVWTNLISNALHAMGNEGTLRIEADTPDPAHVLVRITDSGDGIEPDVLGKVFDLHFTTKDGRVEFGMGMGLPICRQIVDEHGGEITVASKPGETCFSVVLPTSQKRAMKKERARL